MSTILALGALVFSVVTLLQAVKVRSRLGEAVGIALIVLSFIWMLYDITDWLR